MQVVRKVGKMLNFEFEWNREGLEIIKQVVSLFAELDLGEALSEMKFG